jgi:hypothetical protein
MPYFAISNNNFFNLSHHISKAKTKSLSWKVSIQSSAAKDSMIQTPKNRKNINHDLLLFYDYL